jgi:hypothetical protein
MRALTCILVFLSLAALCRAETTCEPNIPADVGADCMVDFCDFAIMAAHWLRPSVPHQWVTTELVGNFNRDYMGLKAIAASSTRPVGMSQ